MADNTHNDQNGLGDNATSDKAQELPVGDLINDINTGRQQADSVVDQTCSEPALSPQTAADMGQHDNLDERPELPGAPVAEMLPPNPPDSPQFCGQEPEARHEPVTLEPLAHHPAPPSAGPVYSWAPTQQVPGAQPLCTSDVPHGTTDAQRGRFHGTTDANRERFHCPLCPANYTRMSRVRDHFDSCQYSTGNPDGVEWNAHPSCWPKRTAHNPADKECPICHCIFSRPSEALAHFVLCAESTGNPRKIVFQGMSTGKDTLHGEEEGEVGAFRCALCGKLSGKRSHARTHWETCKVKDKTPARKLLGRYDDLGRILPDVPEEGEEPGKEPADDGEKVAKKPRQAASKKYKCELCEHKNRKLDRAKDHFQRCLQRFGLSRQDASYLDDTGGLLRPVRHVEISDPTTRKRTYKVAFRDYEPSEEEAANDTAAATAEPATKKHAAEESGDVDVVPDTIRTQGTTKMPDRYELSEEFYPHREQHVLRVFPSLKQANKRAADYFISEATCDWTAEDQAGQKKIDFVKEVYDVLPVLKEGQGFWAKERDCKMDGKVGTLIIMVEKRAAPKRDW